MIPEPLAAYAACGPEEDSIMRRAIYAGLMIGVLVGMSLYMNVGRAQAALLSNATAPFTQYLLDTCSGKGEYVELSGQMHFVTAETLNGESIHLEEHVTAQAVGTGTLGTRYILNAANNISANATLNPSTETVEVTQMLTDSLISAGAAPNLVVHVQTHLTVNATGSIMVTVMHVSLECR